MGCCNLPSRIVGRSQRSRAFHHSANWHRWSAPDDSNETDTPGLNLSKILFDKIKPSRIPGTCCGPEVESVNAPLRTGVRLSARDTSARLPRCQRIPHPGTLAMQGREP